MRDPYTPPRSDVSGAAEVPDAVRIRTEHLHTERYLRAFGRLFLLGAVVAIGSTALLARTLAAGDPVPAELALLAVSVGVGLASTWTGWMLATLNPRGRVPALVLSALALFSPPVGTVTGGLVLYLLMTEKGRFVLSEEYAAIRAATPEVRARTSPVVWVVLGLMALGCAGVLLLGCG